MALLQSKDMLSMGQSWMLCKSRVAMETTILPYTPSPKKDHSVGQNSARDRFHQSIPQPQS